MAESKGRVRSRASDKSGSRSSYNLMIRAKIRAAIRKVWSLYAQERIVVMAEAKRYRRRYNKDGSISKLKNVFYVCNVCNGEHKEKDVQCDHIEPVGATPYFPPVEGNEVDTWDQWLMRVFTDKSNLQCICKDCH